MRRYKSEGVRTGVGGHQLVNQLVAQPINVHGKPRGKVLKTGLDLRLTAEVVGTTMLDLLRLLWVLLTNQRRPADRASVGEPHLRSRLTVRLIDHRLYPRDDVARSLDGDLVSDPQSAQVLGLA